MKKKGGKVVTFVLAQNFSRRSARLIRKKPQPCRKLPDVLAYSRLRKLAPAFEEETAMERLDRVETRPSLLGRRQKVAFYIREDHVEQYTSESQSETVTRSQSVIPHH